MIRPTTVSLRLDSYLHRNTVGLYFTQYGRRLLPHSKFHSYKKVAAAPDPINLRNSPHHRSHHCSSSCVRRSPDFVTMIIRIVNDDHVLICWRACVACIASVVRVMGVRRLVTPVAHPCVGTIQPAIVATSPPRLVSRSWQLRPSWTGR